MRKLLIAGGVVVLVALVVVGLSQTSTENKAPSKDELRFTPAQIEEELAGSPAPLAAVHAQSSELLGGGKDAVNDRLEQLKAAGVPVVVNKWASWCGPCRAEFPHFQNLSVEFGKRVAFLGLNSGDNEGDAAEFLSDFPVSYPSYQDPNEKAALDLGVSAAYPATIFFDAEGEKVYTKQGLYADEADLVADVEKYALGAG
jgi:cytochrome c biogenesis protein CcmG, thiol:disulfide interchange protein DsbE